MGNIFLCVLLYRLIIKYIAMIITKIETEDQSIYSVTLEPNAWERFWGKKTVVNEYKLDERYKYMFGGRIYIDRTGKELGNFSEIGKAIDNFRRSW